ncbi:probable ATP-dependent RNA helicase DHX37 [Ornithodoros turicata]|uniref:probable ATP-dependent RNA helicase DHX37 n=1 Tax=Ornithodoros turicata TaxID=34597 RepID=UPI00313A03EF
MDRRRKRSKRRSDQTTSADTQSAEKIELDLDIQEDKYDSCNALVLPSKKRKTKEAKQETSPQKKGIRLSAKKRKLLEKVIIKKKKKSNRAQLLEDLQKNQASDKLLSLMISTSAMQTKGLKRFSELASTTQPEDKTVTRINSIKGSNPLPRKQPHIHGDNMLSLDHQTSSSSDESEPDEAPEEESGAGENKKLLETSSDAQRRESSLPSPPLEPTTVIAKCSDDFQKALSAQTETTHKPSTYIPVQRSPEIQASRLQLPILAEEQVIMEAINENDIVIICGQTGSGKTTQVPQFLYEAGYASESGIIGITEPRRVAAVSMSKRVGEEMSLKRAVSYQIRFEGNTSEETKIKFMTDGVLLKEVQNNFLLTKYSVVIIDEAHERSIYSDILIGLLSRIVPLRRKRGKPLKLIIMSATLRVEDFTQNKHLFKVSPPVIKVETRQHPVTIHFNKKSPEDYIQEAYRKVCKIHQQLPEGGILVFVTGQQEVISLCRKLQKRYPVPQGVTPSKTAISSSDVGEDVQLEEDSAITNKTSTKEKGRINLDNYSVVPLDEGQLEEIVKDAEPNDGVLSSDDDGEAEPLAKGAVHQPLTVLPLFSLLPSDKQAKVFEHPPEGTRLCVVATNVAETSLTIPNVKYVVDTGKVKMRVYDKVTGISAFMITWVSKASADQRAGRAGRTCPGHCYRLYSSAVYNDEFPKFTPPEITRKPVDGLLLQMKAMNIDKVVNFPFPSPPDKVALQAAEKKLILMGALTQQPKPARLKDLPKWEWSSRVTPLGRAMSCFPVSPRYAKMLAVSHQHNLLPYTVAVVSAMTVQELFYDPAVSEHGQAHENHKRWKKVREMWAGEGNSLALGDIMVLLKAVGASEYVGCTPHFCERHGLRYKAMVEVRKLRIQLTKELNLLIPDINLSVDPKMDPPSDLQAKLIRQVVMTGLSDHVAKKLTDDERHSENKEVIARNAYKSIEVDDPVFIHPSSVLSTKQPLFVMYQEIFETTVMSMRVVAEVDPDWLPVYAPMQCVFSAPLEDPAPRYSRDDDKVLCSVKATFGPYGWSMGVIEKEYPEGLDRYRWFARYLLEGAVLPFFNSYRRLLLSPPVTMVKSWSRLQPRTESLLGALASSSVDSREKLVMAWECNSQYLLKEYLEWVQESLHGEISLKWPPTKK